LDGISKNEESKMKHSTHHLFLLHLLCLSRTIVPTMVVPGNALQAPHGFNAKISAKAFDPVSGSFFVGLTGKNTGKYALSCADRPNKTPSIFKPFAPAAIENKSIELLTLSYKKNTQSVAAFVTAAEKLSTSTTITALLTNGTQSVTTPELNDASGTQTTQGIIALAASPEAIFAAVRPHNGNFGDEQSGIAMIDINRATKNTLTLITKNTPNGTAGNKAYPLSAQSPLFTGNTHPVTFTRTQQNNVTLYYDEPLKTLYCGASITTANECSAIGKAVVRALLTPCGLDGKEIVANSAIDGANNIIVAKKAAANLSIHHLSILHASTGPSYLVVNGGIGTATAPSHALWALPLVDNPGNTQHGSLAHKNGSLINGKFVEPATRPHHLMNEKESAALIGNGTLPTDPTTPISDIVVVGDTVYVSFAVPFDKQNDTGIFYSQALYDAQGKIACWTPWTKRAVPKENDGRVHCFSVDPVTGTMWIVDGATESIVSITSWTNGTDKNGLTSQLSAALSNGCYAALDLDQATRGFIGATNHRYALFGGFNKVVFTRISEALYKNNIGSPQTIITDFTNKKNLLITSLPQKAGRVTSVEYSKREAPDKNFFFAGTENGLFVFSHQTGEGFTSNDLKTFDTPPFTNGIWHKADAITGTIIDMKCAGNALYIISSEMDILTPFKTMLYTIPFSTILNNEPVSHTNMHTLCAPSNIHAIAQSNKGFFSNVTSFSGIGIISTGTEDAQNDNSADKREQLVLATSNGLFKTNANQQDEVVIIFSGSADAHNEDHAHWSVIPGTEKTFIGIATIDAPVQHTVWPFSFEDDKKLKTYNKSCIHQISGSEDPLCGADQATIGTCNQPFKNNTVLLNQHFDPISFFWTDGARRFFIFNQRAVPSSKKIGIFDSNTATEPFIISNSTVDHLKNFFWIKAIGTSGLILAGTDQGVIELG
jgi:hypothetical protein